MKKKFSLLTLFVLILTLVSPKKFSNSTSKRLDSYQIFGDDLVNVGLFGGSSTEITRGVIETSNGTIITAGITYSNGSGQVPPHAGSQAGLLVGFDNYMNHKWTSVVSGSKYRDEQFWGLSELDNGNIVAYGKSNSSAQGDITDVNNGGDDVLVATFTPDGKKISTMLYGGDQNDVLLAAHPLQNGSFIGVGYTSSSMSGDITATSNGGQDGLVMKFDSNGDVVWTKLIGGLGIDVIRGIKVSPAGDIYISGQSNSGSNGSFSNVTTYGAYDGFMGKLNSSGDLLWIKRYGGGAQDDLYNVSITNDGNLLVGGWTASSSVNGISATNRGRIDGLVVKVDSTDGEMIWGKIYGGSDDDYIYDVKQTTEGKILALGKTASTDSTEFNTVSYGGSDAILLTLDSDGIVVNATTFGGKGGDLAYQGLALSGDRYLLIGDSASSFPEQSMPNNGANDMFYVIKTFGPEISHNGNIVIFEGEEFDYLDGLNATDFEDGDLISSVTWNDLGPDISNEVGTHLIKYVVTDSDGNKSELERSLIVKEDNPPIIRFLAPLQIHPGQTVDPLFRARASDDKDGNITNSLQVTGLPVDTTVPGEYTLEYTVTDSWGHTVTAYRTLIITNDPIITHPGDSEITEGSSFDPLEGVSASDVEDGPIANITVSSDLDVNEPGIYTVTYTVTDSHGNSATTVRVVTVLSVPPVFVTEDMVIDEGSEFTLFDGITATDVYDGNLTDSITVLENNFDVNEPGVYNIVYSVTDSHANTIEVKRKVTVLPIGPSIVGDDIVISEGSDFDLLDGMSASDKYDGDLTNSIIVLANTFDVNVPKTYEITYLVTDTHGIKTFLVRNVVVKSVPKIHGVDDVAVNPDSSFDPMEGISATDLEDGNFTVEQIKVTGGVDTSTPGKYELMYSVTDTDNNTTSVKRVVTVTNKPVITGADDITININQKFDPFAGVKATDNEDGNLSYEFIVNSNLVSGKEGEYTIEYRAVDSDGNVTVKVRTVTVVKPPYSPGPYVLMFIFALLAVTVAIIVSQRFKKQN